MSERLASLPAVETAIWQQLAACINDKSHAWRTAVLATIDDERADARTVVLRELDAHAKRLLIYTDERAGKVHQLMRQPLGTLVMWSQALGWQLRCRVHLSIEMAGLSASSRWARMRLSPAAQDYLSPLAPGAPLPSDAPTLPPVSRDYFAVIEAGIESLDWLELHADGHRRAIFDDQGARWVQP